MQESYCECSVNRKKTAGGLVLKVVLILAVIGLLLSSVLFFWLSFVGVAAAGFVIWYWPRFDVMIEYVYCDGQIDFDQIFGGEKRKTALRIELEDADAVAPVGSEKLAGYQHLPVKDFSSREEGARVYGIATRLPGSEDKVRILFEPNDRMLDMMETKCPRIVEK